MVTDIVQTALCTFDTLEFVDLEACPFCGGKVQGYDTREKRYAVIREGAGERTITVRVKRFTCRTCHRFCNADEPFYPGTRIGSLVVDLFVTFTSAMPLSRAARIIDAMGIVVNRTTWRNYSELAVPAIPATDIFGMRLPASVLTISSIAASHAGNNCMDVAKMLAACNFPSKFRPQTNIPQPAGKKAEGQYLQEEGPLQFNPESGSPVR